jgi:predicted glycoside hydrolase/deacetylase ChbG (UPF0249 family)
VFVGLHLVLLCGRPWRGTAVDAAGAG